MCNLLLKRWRWRRGDDDDWCPKPQSFLLKLTQHHFERLWSYTKLKAPHKIPTVFKLCRYALIHQNLHRYLYLVGQTLKGNMTSLDDCLKERALWWCASMTPFLRTVPAARWDSFFTLLVVVEDNFQVWPYSRNMHLLMITVGDTSDGLLFVIDTTSIDCWTQLLIRDGHNWSFQEVCRNNYRVEAHRFHDMLGDTLTE